MIQRFEFVAAIPAAPKMMNFIVVLVLRLKGRYRHLSTCKATRRMSKKGDGCHLHPLFTFRDSVRT
jgi:hypothetical protein